MITPIYYNFNLKYFGIIMVLPEKELLLWQQLRLRLKITNNNFFKRWRNLRDFHYLRVSNVRWLKKYENDYDLKVAEISIAEFQKYIISDKPVQSWEDLQPELGLDRDV